MRQVNMAISSLTHAHVRKYYATLNDNAKLNWVAVSCANEAVAEDFKLYGYDIPIYMSTDGNIKVSMELGFSPDGSEPVLLHEVIGKNGLACDVVVDTQTQQYPIYVFKGKETLKYTDIDAELYDMENTQVDSVRFILWALTDTARIDALCENYAHIEKVYEAALAANADVRYTTVEG